MSQIIGHCVCQRVRHMPEVKRKKKSEDWINVTQSPAGWKVNWHVIGWKSSSKQKVDEKYKILGIYPEEKERGMRRRPRVFAGAWLLGETPGASSGAPSPGLTSSGSQAAGRPQDTGPTLVCVIVSGVKQAPSNLIPAVAFQGRPRSSRAKFLSFQPLVSRFLSFLHTFSLLPCVGLFPSTVCPGTGRTWKHLRLRNNNGRGPAPQN